MTINPRADLSNGQLSRDCKTHVVRTDDIVPNGTGRVDRRMNEKKTETHEASGSDVTQQQGPAWSIRRVLSWLVLYVLMSFFVGAMTGFLITYFNQAIGWGLGSQDIVMLLQTYIFLTTVLVSIAFLKWQCKKVDLSIRVLWGIQVHGVGYVILAIVSGVLISLLWNWKMLNIENLPAKLTYAIFGFQLIVRGLVVPFQEELYFRGILYRTLRKRCSCTISSLSSTTIFLAYHVQYSLDPASLFVVFLFGMLAAFLVERTDSLTSSFFCHSIVNVIHVVMFQYASYLLL